MVGLVVLSRFILIHLTVDDRDTLMTLHDCGDKRMSASRMFLSISIRELQPVMVHQHIDEVFEEVGLGGAEVASRNLVHCLLQFWDLVVVRHGIIAGDKRH